MDAVEVLIEVERGLGKLELIPTTVAAKRIGELLGVSAATARKKIDEQITAGALIVLTPVQYTRRVVLPGGAELPKQWVSGTRSRQEAGFHLVDHDPAGWALGNTTFVLSSSRCEELVAVRRAAAEAADEKRRQREEENTARSQARTAQREHEFREHFPAVADVLGQLRRLFGPDSEIRMSGVIVPGHRPGGWTDIKVSDEDFPVLERVLRAGVEAELKRES